MSRFDGKSVISTGVRMGSSEAIARTLADKGASITVADLYTARGQRVSASLPSAIAVEVDVADEAQNEPMTGSYRLRTAMTPLATTVNGCLYRRALRRDTRALASFDPAAGISVKRMRSSGHDAARPLDPSPTLRSAELKAIIP